METLPNEVVLVILRWLNERDLARVACCSQRLRKLALEEGELMRRLRAQPLAYPAYTIAKDLLLAPGVPSTKILRFIVDLEKTDKLLSATYARRDITVSRAKIHSATGENARWYLLWAACRRDNPYLAQAIYHGYGLRYVPNHTNADVYFDLLFRHGMWEEAKRSIGCKLSGGSWLIERVPPEFRADLFCATGPEHSDVVGFRKVYGPGTIMERMGKEKNPSKTSLHLVDFVVSPHVGTDYIVAVFSSLKDFPASLVGPGLLLAIAASVRGLRSPQEGWVEQLFCKIMADNGHTETAVLSYVMAFMREGRLEEDSGPLLALLPS